MKLDLKALFGGDTQPIAIEEQLDFHDLQYGSYCPLRQPVRVTGQAYAKADVCYLDLDLSFVFDGVCDRCASEFTRAVQIPIHAVLVSEEELEQAEDEWVFGIHDGCADLTDIITTAFVLNMDSQLLCRPDCKGVCFRCGKNLNEGPCGCRKEPDSRFAVLQQLLDK